MNYCRVKGHTTALMAASGFLVSSVTRLDFPSTSRDARHSIFSDSSLFSQSCPFPKQLYAYETCDTSKPVSGSRQATLVSRTCFAACYLVIFPESSYCIQLLNPRLRMHGYGKLCVIFFDTGGRLILMGPQSLVFDTMSQIVVSDALPIR